MIFWICRQEKSLPRSTDDRRIPDLTSKKSKRGDYMATHLADRAHLNMMHDAAQAKRLSAHNQAGIISKYLPQLPQQTAKGLSMPFLLSLLEIAPQCVASWSSN